MKVDIYTDGSVWPNPNGTGGWAAILIAGEHRKELSGYLVDATNNTAELEGVIQGLRALRGGPHEVVIHTDSEYAQGAIVGMKKPKANLELLATIRGLVAAHTVTVEWVRGHTGDPENERANQLANQARSDHDYQQRQRIR